MSFLPPANKIWGKVIFLQACVINSVHWQGLHPRGGVCIQGGGSASLGGVDQSPPLHRILQDTVNERVVHILVECIIVISLKLKKENDNMISMILGENTK